jgi:hypothetical protein
MATEGATQSKGVPVAWQNITFVDFVILACFCIGDKDAVWADS